MTTETQGKETPATNKRKADAVWSKLNDMFGGVITKASEPIKQAWDVIKFPNPSLADATHFGGVPLGRITQFHGPEGCGKTFYAMLMVKEVQEQYPTSEAVWFDCEFSFNEDWAESLGIDLDRLRIIRDNNAGNVFSMICGIPGKKDAKPKPGILDMAEAGIADIKLIVLDSIASLIPPVEEGRSVDEQDIAALARFLPKAMRVTSSKLAKSGTAMICINQAREKIGEMIPTMSYPGGRAYRHFLSLAVLFNNTNAKSSMLLDSGGKNKIGHKCICTVEKTRGGPNRYKAEIWLNFYEGIAKLGEEIAMLGKAYDVVELPNNRTWVYDAKEIVGKDNFFQYLEDNPDVAEKLLQDCKEAKEQGYRRSEELSDGASDDEGVDTEE